MARPREFDENEVLDKAMDLFWYQGYEATSIQDLTQHMGISRGSLYDSFGDKRTLFVTVLDRYGRQFRQQLQTMLTPPHSAREGIEQLFHYIVHDALTHPKRRGCLITNSTIELTPHDDKIANEIVRNTHNIEELIHQAVVRGQVEGEISARTEARALARFLLNSLQGLRVVSKAPTSRDMLEDIVSVTLAALD